MLVNNNDCESFVQSKNVFSSGFIFSDLIPVSIYLLKDNNRNPKTKCEMCSKLFVIGVVLVSLLSLLLEQGVNIFHTLF